MVTFKKIYPLLVERKLEVFSTRGYYRLKKINSSAMDNKNVYWDKFVTYEEILHFLQVDHPHFDLDSF